VPSMGQSLSDRDWEQLPAADTSWMFDATGLI
jgi:hypothetical protein